MPETQFFGFTNPPSYLFFRWVRDGGGHDPEALVSAAMNAAEYEDGFQLDGDVSLAARDALAKMLGAIVSDLRAAAGCGAEDEPVGPEPAWPIQALLADAIEQIDCAVVAEALLMDAGRWGPDAEGPEPQ